MAQAIITKFLGPTNTKGARIKASTGLGNTASSATTDYHSLEGNLSNEERYRSVAQELVDKINSERSHMTTSMWVLQEFKGLAMPTGDGYAFGMELVWL